MSAWRTILSWQEVPQVPESRLREMINDAALFRSAFRDHDASFLDMWTEAYSQEHLAKFLEVYNDDINKRAKEMDEGYGT